LRIAIATDAWHPQVNGVVRVNVQLADALTAAGHEVLVLSHEGLRTFALPTYPEIRLAWRPRSAIAAQLDAFAPDALHIATEGPIGLAARAHARKRGWPFTTHVHTRFPEYVQLRTGLPLAIGYRLMRWFHGRAARVIAPTPSMAEDLIRYGVPNVHVLSHGVDCTRFAPPETPAERLSPLVPQDWPRPIYLFVGRVAIEKNIDAFLALDLPGTKVVAGVGPELERLRTAYPQARFLGILAPEALASVYRASDVFVFPSRTDTFGLVLLEAMACGTPVAAYPVPGPIDVVGTSPAAALDEDLQAACANALQIPRPLARAHAAQFSWETTARQFVELLAPIEAPRRAERTALAG